MADFSPETSAGKANIAQYQTPGGASSVGIGDIFGGAATGASTGAMLGPWGALVGGIFGAGASMLGTSPQESAMEDVIKSIKDAEEYLKSTPFTKDEVMNQLLPQAQKIYRGAADVMAGKAGAAVGEAGVPKGQAFAEYYTQALAPIVASGEQQAGDAISRFGKWFSDMDAQGKGRFIESMKLLMTGTQGLSGMTPLQKGVTGGMEGARIGAGVAGDFDILSELKKLMQGKEDLATSTTQFGNVNVRGD